MSVCPALPRLELREVESHVEASEWNGANDVDASQSHEAEESVICDTAPVTEDLAHVQAVLVKVVDTRDCIEGQSGSSNDTDARTAEVGGNEADDNRPNVHKDDRHPGAIDERVASNLLDDIEAMALRNVGNDHLQHRNAYPDSQVDDDTAANVAGSLDYLLILGNGIETTIDAQGCAGNGDGVSEDQAGG
jgi:hypothetical protein